MIKDSAFWRRLREDFEGLEPGQFSLICSSQLSMGPRGERLQSHWTWWRFPDENQRARLRAIVLRGARALGHDSEDAWFDKLREADFVKFKPSGECREKQPDGSILEASDGSINDVVGQSITLCYIQEAEAESFPKGFSRHKSAAQGGGFTRPIRPQTDSHTAVNCGDEENRSRVDWDTIEITFLSDERVQIRNGANTETCNYAELGFADLRVGRGSPKPNLAWVTLRAMAEQKGVIRDGSKTRAEWPKVERRMQEIRKALRKHFGISADPVPFLAGTGYQACFKICCGPSFHT